MEKFEEMPSCKRTNSNPGDDKRYAMMDEKKRKRMISNRESARRSRMKKEHHIKDLNEQIMCFKSKRDEMVEKINEVTGRCVAVEAENRILRAQREELRKRLESAEIVASYVYGAGGFSMESAPQEPWLKPWQPSFNSLSIMTSGGVFQF